MWAEWWVCGEADGNVGRLVGMCGGFKESREAGRGVG